MNFTFASISGFHVGDLLIQLFFFIFILLIVVLVVFLILSSRKRKNRMDTLEEKIEAIQSKLEK